MSWEATRPAPADFADVQRVISDPQRLDAVHRTGLVGEEVDPELLRLARDARRTLDVPTVCITLLDGERQHFVAAEGLSSSLEEARSTPMSHAFCFFTVGRGRPMIVPDARQHDDLRDNPAIAEHECVAYVGVPVNTVEGQTVGAFCATDVVPRFWSREQVDTLNELADRAASRIDTRMAVGGGARGH